MVESATDVSRRALQAEHDRLVAIVDSLTRTISSIDDATRLSATDDEHDPEGSTIAFERSQSSALLASSRQRLGEIESALAKVGSEAFGRCERCGRAIAPERLLARPATRTCISCAAAGP